MVPASAGSGLFHPFGIRDQSSASTSRSNRASSCLSQVRAPDRAMTTGFASSGRQLMCWGEQWSRDTAGAWLHGVFWYNYKNEDTGKMNQKIEDLK